MSESYHLRSRLCHALVVDWLAQMEVELLDIKSVAALANHHWPAGKRLRPITFLLSYFTMQAENGVATELAGREVRLAAALELMHEASLVHDDLVDQSAIRRGKPTVQMHQGAGRALLIGDYMVFRALKLVLDATEQYRDVVLAQQLADMGLGIAHGQLQQLEQFLNAEDASARMSLDAYTDVISKKTALFFAGCAEGGASLAGATAELRGHFHQFGLSMGIAFQMLDDLIDVMGDPEMAAKSLSNNLLEGTVTLPFIMAYQSYPKHQGLRRLANAEKLSARQRQRTLALVTQPDVVALCQQTIVTQLRQTLVAWEQLPVNIFRSGLLDLVDYVCKCCWGGMPALFSGVEELQLAVA